MNTKKRKFILLYLKTGGGHLAPAKSLVSQLNKKYPGIDTLLVDGFEKAPRILKAVIEGGYRSLQYKAKWIYELLYAMNKLKFVAHIDAWIISFFIKKHLAGLLARENPEKIILFHFFLIEPVYKAASVIKPEIKIITVVTDPFTAHPLWFLNKEQNFIVFSRQLKNDCIGYGINESSIKVFPFIVDEKFSKTLSAEEKQKVKDKYSIKQDRNVLLILGGGDGIPKGKRILKILLDNYRDTEILIICGKNESLFNRAAQIKESGNYSNLHIFGYINFVYELINISDVVITKCGASTFMEIIISGKIPVITSYIWEQEKGNKDFVVRNEMGVYVKKIRDLHKVLDNVLSKKEVYERNIENAGIRNGAEEVADFLAG